MLRQESIQVLVMVNFICPWFLFLHCTDMYMNILCLTCLRLRGCIGEWEQVYSSAFPSPLWGVGIGLVPFLLTAAVLSLGFWSRTNQKMNRAFASLPGLHRPCWPDSQSTASKLPILCAKRIWISVFPVIIPCLCTVPWGWLCLWSSKFCSTAWTPIQVLMEDLWLYIVYSCKNSPFSKLSLEEG